MRFPYTLSFRAKQDRSQANDPAKSRNLLSRIAICFFEKQMPFDFAQGRLSQLKQFGVTVFSG
jgi:hypothetical protein